MTSVVVVGGGIAGWSAAWFATRRGFDVTLVDAGVDRASDLPIALVNPVRGREGRIVARGIEGMHATFALVEALGRDGHAVICGRGLFRPLLDASLDREGWSARLPRGLGWRWHASAPSSLGLANDVPAIEWTDAGWIAPRSLFAALATCGARVIDDEAIAIAATAVVLANGERLVADHVVWCGGAWGAARLDRSSERADLANDDGHYRPGSLVVAPHALTSDPLAFGLYAVPLDRRHGIDADPLTVLGPTSEASRNDYPDGHLPPDAFERLTADVATTFRTPATLAPLWRGVRLSRLSTRARATLAGVRTITALGSRGFLMAPLLADEWAASL